MGGFPIIKKYRGVIKNARPCRAGKTQIYYVGNIILLPDEDRPLQGLTPNKKCRISTSIVVKGPYKDGDALMIETLNSIYEIQPKE